MMTHMKNLLTILLILLPLSAHAWGVVVTSGGVAAAPAGCSEGSDHVIIGGTSVGAGFQISPGYISFGQWPAQHSCTIDSMTLYIGDTLGVGCHIRAAIYADDGSNHPTGAPLASTAQGTVTAATGNSEVIGPLDLSATVELTASTNYWIGIVIDGVSAIKPGNNSATGRGGYFSWTYSSTGELGTISSPSYWDYFPSVTGLSE